MLVHRKVTPSVMLLVPIHGRGETMWSKVSCLRTQPIYTPGQREKMWNKAFCLRKQHDGTDLMLEPLTSR